MFAHVRAQRLCRNVPKQRAEQLNLKNLDLPFSHEDILTSGTTLPFVVISRLCRRLGLVPVLNFTRVSLATLALSQFFDGCIKFFKKWNCPRHFLNIINRVRYDVLFIN